MDWDNIKKEYNDKLEFFKDPKFIFEEENHSYTFNGIKYDSVTTFLKRFKVPFEREYWIKRKSREMGIDPSVLESEWAQKANTATELGTRVHKWIEDFWTGLDPELPEDPIDLLRIHKFLELYEARFKKLVPLKSELKVFSKKWKLAGTVDQPFLMWDEKKQEILFLIGDWKTNKEFKDDQHPKGRYKKLLHPFNDLYENSHNEYSIQISLYRLIIEEELGIETHGGFLVHIGPDSQAKIYPIKDLRERLKIYLQHNREDFDLFDV
jgi:hypothetical protein